MAQALVKIVTRLIKRIPPLPYPLNFSFKKIANLFDKKSDISKIADFTVSFAAVRSIVASPMHLYLHIPFCHRICPYCAFYKHTPGEVKMGLFVESLLKEARFHAEKWPLAPETIYFGGGTPSMLSPTHLRALFSGLREIFPWKDLREVTFEANPATFTARTADFYGELGITRVSLGIQAFTEKELKILGREHSVAQAQQSAELLKNAGSLEVNIDLMFSVPGQGLSDWETSLRSAIALEPQHISAYNLTYEEDTAYFEQFKKGSFSDDPDLNADMFVLAEQWLTAAGYEHYETSNYARPGFRSTHNEGYWKGHDYLGLGPSAVSTVARRRWKNVPDTAAYLRRIDTLGHALEEVEVLDDEAFRLERLALMLRTSDGLPLEFLTPENAADLARLQAQGLVEISESALSLCGDGPLLVDAIAAELA